MRLPQISTWRKRGTSSRCSLRAFLALVVLAVPSLAFGDETAKARSATEAKNHIDEKGTYELVVRTSKNADKSKVYYLDSEENFRDEKNLAIVISYDDAEKFKKAGVDDPSAYYKGKTIRVTGKVIYESDQVRIHVTEPAQIEVVDSKKAQAPR